MEACFRYRNIVRWREVYRARPTAPASVYVGRAAFHTLGSISQTLSLSLPDFLTDLFCGLLGYTRPADGRYRCLSRYA
jgi:hypothetical protein